MASVYEITAYLAIALLAIVVAVFVLGVSLLGRAIKRSTQEKKEAEERNSAKLKEKITVLEKKLVNCRDEKTIKILQDDISKLRIEQRNHERRIRRIEKSPRFLTVKGGVLPPGLCLLVSLSCSMIATQVTASCSTIIWLTGVIFLCIAVILVMNSLTTIQEVAIVSDEASQKASVDAFTEALKLSEESKKPILGFNILNPIRPISVGVQDEFEIAFDVSLIQGDVAQKIEVFFLSPPQQFTFPHMSTWIQDTYVAPFGGYLSTMIPIPDVKKGLRSVTCTLNAKAPSTEGLFKILYRITCYGYDSEQQEIQIKVVSKSK